MKKFTFTIIALISAALDGLNSAHAFGPGLIDSLVQEYRDAQQMGAESEGAATDGPTRALLTVRKNRPLLEILALQQAEQAELLQHKHKKKKKHKHKKKDHPSPSPSPAPSPPAPSPPAPIDPSDLPDVPKKDLWFGMWGSTDDSNDFTSVVWDVDTGDGTTDAYIEAHGADDTRFLYPVDVHLCHQNRPGCKLHHDYKERWQKLIPKVTRYLQEKKILGFFAGDEHICHNKDDGPSIKMIDLIRDTFPKGKAIIYMNECGSTWSDYDIPKHVDWVSSDRYREKTSQKYVESFKEAYKDILKKLGHDQYAGIVPGIGHPRNHFKMCNDECTAKIELQDMKDFKHWADNEDKIIFMAPYAWARDGSKDGDKLCRDMYGKGSAEIGLRCMDDGPNVKALKDYLKQVGKSTKK